MTKKEKSELTDTQGDGKQQKKDERHKKALAGGGQKGGAGRGGRESSTKKTKNKYRDRGDADDGEAEANFNAGKKKTSEIPFLTVDQVLSFSLDTYNLDSPTLTFVFVSLT